MNKCEPFILAWGWDAFCGIIDKIVLFICLNRNNNEMWTPQIPGWKHWLNASGFKIVSSDCQSYVNFCLCVSVSKLIESNAKPRTALPLHQRAHPKSWPAARPRRWAFCSQTHMSCEFFMCSWVGSFFFLQFEISLWRIFFLLGHLSFCWVNIKTLLVKAILPCSSFTQGKCERNIYT